MRHDTIDTEQDKKKGSSYHMAKKKLRKTIDMPEDLSLLVDDYEKKYHHSSNAQAIIQLIHYGLIYAKKIEDATVHPLYTEPQAPLYSESEKDD